jgi:predicted acetyltransferase
VPQNIRNFDIENSELLSEYLVGDVNINLSFNDGSNDLESEINIMIAEASARRKGLSSQILIFIQEKLKDNGISKRIVANINEDNE